MFWPSVTINFVIAKYHERLTHSLEALLRQTYPHFRIVISLIDGCDETHLGLERFDAMPLIRINRATAREVEEQHVWTGCAFIEDEYVLFAHPEYPLLPTCLENLMRPVQRCVDPARLVYGNGVITSDSAIERAPGIEVFAFSGRAEIGEILLLGSHFDRSYPLLCHVPSLKEVGGYIAGLGSASIYELLLRFAQAELIVDHLPDVLTFPLPDHEVQGHYAEFAKAFVPHYLTLIKKYMDQPTAVRLHHYERRILAAVSKASYPFMSYHDQQVLLQGLSLQFQELALMAHRDRKPSVSVIAIVDSMNDLQDVLDQIEPQSYESWELVLVQMGPISFEGLCLYRSNIKDRIRSVHAPLTNRADCWTQAHTLAQGSFITYLDSSTQWDAQHLERMVETLQESGSAGAVATVLLQLQDNDGTCNFVLPSSKQCTQREQLHSAWIERSSIMIHACHLDKGLWHLPSSSSDAYWVSRLGELLDYFAENTLAIGFKTNSYVRIQGDARQYFERWNAFLRKRQQRNSFNPKPSSTQVYSFEALRELARELGAVEPVASGLVV